VRRNRREHLPQLVRVGADGAESDQGTVVHFVPAPFRFCLCCGVAYGSRQNQILPSLLL
jgi:hypothetical protein